MIWAGVEITFLKPERELLLHKKDVVVVSDGSAAQSVASSEPVQVDRGIARCAQITNSAIVPDMKMPHSSSPALVLCCRPKEDGCGRKDHSRCSIRILNHRRLFMEKVKPSPSPYPTAGSVIGMARGRNPTREERKLLTSNIPSEP